MYNHRMSLWRSLEEIAQWASIVAIALIMLRELRRVPPRPDGEDWDAEV